MIYPVVISTDGAYSSKSGEGGWSFVLQENDGHYETGYGWEPKPTTNQRMEMLGVIRGLEYVVKTRPGPMPIKILTDSSYVVNCFKHRWHVKWMKNEWINSQGLPVSNRDLWEQMFELVNVFPKVHFAHIKGHRGHITNEIADQLAVEARTGHRRGGSTLMSSNA